MKFNKLWENYSTKFGVFEKIWIVISAVPKLTIILTKLCILNILPQLQKYLIQWFHQSGQSQSGVGLSPVQCKWKVGLDWTTDCQSSTGRARSGPVHTHLQIWHCFIVKYHWKHDSSSHWITTHLWIPTVGDNMTVLSVYSVPFRYISHIERPIQWEIYPDSGHSAGLVHASPVQSSPGPTELGTGPIPVQKLLGLEWINPGLVQSGLVHPRTGGIINSIAYRIYLKYSKLPYFVLGQFDSIWKYLNIPVKLTEVSKQYANNF